MTRYRQKIVMPEVDAIRWTGDNLRSVLSFTGRDPRFDKWFASFEAYREHVERDGRVFKIFNGGTILQARVGDWVVRTQNGRCFPMTNDEFTAKYEEAK